MFPAAGMQCAGRIIRGDQWCADDIRLILHWISGGTYPPTFFRWYFPPGDTYANSVAQAGGQPACGAPPFFRWYFGPIIVPGKPYTVWTATDLYSAGVPSMRLDTGDTFPYNAAPWSSDPAIPDAMLVCKSGHALDGVFHNPL